jgi:hypothetical protein
MEKMITVKKKEISIYSSVGDIDNIGSNIITTAKNIQAIVVNTCASKGK